MSKKCPCPKGWKPSSSDPDEQPNACKSALEVADLYEMLAQQDADLGDRETAKCRMKVANTIRQLRKALIDANGLCRSTASIADREGRETNWGPFRDRLRESLERQHGVMYPETSPHRTARRVMR